MLALTDFHQPPAMALLSVELIECSPNILVVKLICSIVRLYTVAVSVSTSIQHRVSSTATLDSMTLQSSM